MPIEVMSPDLEKIVSSDAPVTELSSGYGGENGPAEGPLWWREGGYLLFSDIHNNRRMKWSAQDGVSLFLEPTNRANGLTRDHSGRLLACEHLTRRVTRLEPDGSITVVASNYRGRRLNRPNDVIVSSKGDIYFTDPGFPAPGMDLDWNGVYHVTPDLGTITLIVWDFSRPNGLALSPDESVLYINDTRRRHIRAFDLEPNGMPLIATDRVFCDLGGKREGNPDGMKVDSEGNVFCGGSGGIWVMDSTGRHLGIIVHGEASTTNMAFGGDDWKTLFYTTRHTLGSVQVNVAGLPVPAGG
ncbi:MAG: SMP-30/gluconolactonase/LRE family protein [Chloroflexota bacterium]|nr:SMP-30/gluconolactonase/LRE family protein [Chloroflexota bacterium]